MVLSTYRNPIIPGYAPDPTCVQHNGTYYLLTSSFLSFPSLPIYTSTDLVHWTLRGNVVSHPRQLERLREAGVRWPIGGGMWAPSLRFREGEGCWYVTVTLVFPQTEFGAKERWENLLFRSRDPLHWPDPPVKFDFPGYDTSLAWDDSEDGGGRAMVQGAHYWRVRPEILQIPLDLTTGSALGPPTKIWSGEGGHAPEAPHAYWKDGWWWLLLAEGGTEAGHRCTLARSRTLSAPHSEWEPCPHNPLLISSPSDSPTPNPQHFTTIGHADLFTTPQGEWMAVALATRDGRDGTEAAMGRETVMISVRWDEGEWPVFQQVEAEMYLPEGAGKHEEVEGIPLLLDDGGSAEDLLALCAEWRSKDPTNPYAFPPHLLFLRLPHIDSYTFSPSTSTLQLRPSPTTLSHHPVAPFSPYPIPSYPCTSTPTDPHAGTCTFLARRQTDLEGSMEVELLLPRSKARGVEAGLTVFLDETHHFQFGTTTSDDDDDEVFLRSTAEGAQEPISLALPSPSSSSSEGLSISLKITWTISLYSFHYRLPSSSSWTRLGEGKARDVTGGFTGVLLGVWSSFVGEGAAGGEEESAGEVEVEVEVRRWSYESRRRW